SDESTRISSERSLAQTPIGSSYALPHCGQIFISKPRKVYFKSRTFSHCETILGHICCQDYGPFGLWTFRYLTTDLTRSSADCAASMAALWILAFAPLQSESPPSCWRRSS